MSEDPTHSPGSADVWLLKLGAPAAILGALLAGIGNVLHPITPRDDPEGVAHVIAQAQHWTAVHVVLVAGTLLMLGGVIAIARTLRGALAEALAQFAVAAATVGATVGSVTVILDGVAAKQLADQWAAAPPGEQAAALSVVSANETVNFALAGLFNAAFAGVPFLLLGLGIAAGRGYPRWLGWVAAIAGLGSIVAGTFQALTGKPTVASLVLTLIGPTVIALWLLVMGVLLGRRAGAGAPEDIPAVVAQPM